MNIGRRTVTAAIAGLVLVVAAFMVPRMHLDGVIPLINSTPAQIRAFAQAAPIFGWWNAHIGWGTVPAVLIALAAYLFARLRFHRDRTFAAPFRPMLRTTPSALELLPDASV